MATLRPLTVAAVLASAVYVVLAVRFAVRIATNDLYSDTRVFLGGWLGATVVLFLVGAAVAFAERRDRGAPVPVLGAALFGSLICVLFYGP